MQTPRAKTSLDHFSPHVSQFVDGPIRVRAIMKGFYGNTLRVPGTVFGIHSMDEFGGWMELVGESDGAEPEQAEPVAPSRAGKKSSKRASDDDVL